MAVKKIPLWARFVLAFGIVAIIVICYKLAAIFASGRTGANLSIFIDDWITFQPFWVIFYILYYPFLLLPIFFARGRRELKKITIRYLLVIALTVPVFLLFVVRIDRPVIDDSGFFSRLVKLIYSGDDPVNLFPSQHVAFAWISSYSLAKIFPSWKLAFYIFATMISLSTVFIKQHYFLDILSGIVVATLTIVLSNRIAG